MANTDTYTAKMAPMELLPGMQVKFEAINTTTGAAVANVTVSSIAIYANANITADAGGTGTVESFGPFMLVPGPNA